MTSEPGDDSTGQAGSLSTSPDPVLPKTGHLIAGKYRIDGILGRGGMGVVVAGHQLNLDRPVAIKFLRHALGETARQRFTREAMAIAKIESEHVVRVFDAGEESGVPFIVMERLVGNDLADELRLRPLDPETTVRYLLEACAALSEAHARGIVHRDLKPSNLFITKGTNGRRVVKVLDFGVSKWLDASPNGETPLSTGDQGFVGTPAYVSPEQLTTPNAVDQRTDVWALGVVLYQCLSGRRPFDVRGVPQLCAAILAAEPPAFEAKLGVPESLAAIVRRCLRKKPEDRYASVRALAEELAAFRVPRGRFARALDALRARPLFAVLGFALLAVVAIAFARAARSGENEAERDVTAEPHVAVAERPETLAATATALATSPAPTTPPASASVRPQLTPSPERAAMPRSESRRAQVAPPPLPTVSVAPSATSVPATEPKPSASADAKPLYRR